MVSLYPRRRRSAFAPPQFPTISAVATTALSTAVGDLSGGYEVTVTGTGFAGGGLTRVTFGPFAGEEDATSVTVVNDTTATCVVPEGASNGLVHVTVHGPGGNRVLLEGFRYWTPLAIGSPLTGWWRGDDVTLTSGKVSSWNDKSGNARHLTQSTAGARPVVASAAINDLDAVEFDATDDCLRGAAISNFFTSTAGQVYSLHRHAALHYNDALSFLNQPVWSDTGQFAGVFVRSTPLINGYNWDGNEDKASVSSGDALTWHLCTWRHSAGMVGIRRGTGSTFTETASGATQFMTGLFDIGSQGTTGGAFDGRMADIFVCNAALSDADDGYARAYFATRYGL